MLRLVYLYIYYLLKRGICPFIQDILFHHILPASNDRNTNLPYVAKYFAVVMRSSDEVRLSAIAKGKYEGTTPEEYSSIQLPGRRCMPVAAQRVC